MDSPSLENMNANRKAVRIVGILFLAQMAAAVMSYSVILDPILHTENYLAELSANSTMVTLAMFFDLTCGACVFAIAVILFPILKRFSERVALWYVGQRLTELVGFMVGGAILLALLTMGQDMTRAAAVDTTYLESQARYLRDARGNIQDVSLLLYCLGAWSFYGLLYRAQLLPRFIPVWGLIAVTLLFIEIVSNVLGTSVGGIWIMMPLGFNEVFLGIWLIARGFNTKNEKPLAPQPG